MYTHDQNESQMCLDPWRSGRRTATYYSVSVIAVLVLVFLFLFPFASLGIKNSGPAAAIGHAIAAGLLIWLIFDFMIHNRLKIALATYQERLEREKFEAFLIANDHRTETGLSDSYDSDAAAALPDPSAGCVWCAAIQEWLRRNTYLFAEWPQVPQDLLRAWCRSLDQRLMLWLAASSIPVVLGFLEGTRTLRVTEAPKVLLPFSEMYQPLVISTIESLLLGLAGLWSWSQWLKSYGQFFEITQNAARKAVNQERRDVAKMPDNDVNRNETGAAVAGMGPGAAAGDPRDKYVRPGTDSRTNADSRADDFAGPDRKSEFEQTIEITADQIPD